MRAAPKRKKCFNPFDKPKTHNKSSKDLRVFRETDLLKFPAATNKSWLCTACRKDVANFSPISNTPSTSSARLAEPSTADVPMESESNEAVTSKESSQEMASEESSQEMASEESSQEIASTQGSTGTVYEPMEALFGLSPVKQKFASRPAYMASKLEQMRSAVDKQFESKFGVLPKTRIDETVKEYTETVENIKKQFHSETKRDRRLNLLALLPGNWSCKRISDEFDCPPALARAAKKLKTDDEIRQALPRKPGNKPLTPSVKQLVIDFYESEENSKHLPGLKDVKSVVQPDGTRKLVQKKLVLSNLHELYVDFKKQNPDVDIGFTSFFILRPAHCILAGSSGTHTVCVCTLHQNVKLMLEGCGFSSLFENNQWIDDHRPTYRTLLNRITCAEPTESCFNRSCSSCRSTIEVSEAFKRTFQEKNMEQIRYKMWTTTDRCTIIDVNCNADEFADSLCQKLETLLLHDFVSKAQSQYYKELKSQLKPGEFLVTADFAENYAFVVQEAAQAFHWNNNQATLFPMIIYYKEDSDLKCCSYVCISDCLKHDTNAVYMFQQELIKYLKDKFCQVKKIYYFSDGAPQQFKNKKAFANLCCHTEDFDVHAEWHFFATAHGKGPCDGLAGTVKRLVRRASLQMGTREQILTPLALFKWARRSLGNIDFVFLENSDYEKTKAILDSRFASAATVHGTLKLHSAKPVEGRSGYLVVKPTSTSTKESIVKIFR